MELYLARLYGIFFKLNFPEKDVTKIHVYNMKRRVETVVPTLKDFHSYQVFIIIFNSSQLEVGIDDTPLTEDDKAEVYRDLWK